MSPTILPPTDLAIFVATSGHSGVDRIIANLLPEFSRAGLRVDLLQVRNHGPWIEHLPPGVRKINLDRSHVTQCFGPIVSYLRATTPSVLLSDKDRANRTALRALERADTATRCFLRLGTTVSSNLANKGILDSWIERRSLRRYVRADGVIVPSLGAADDLANVAGLSRDHIHVLPNPVITSELEDQASRSTPAPHTWLSDASNIPVILACGSLTPRKDYTTLLEAFARLQEYRPSRLLILGRGDDYTKLLSTAKILGIADRVALPGFVENPIPWMRRATVFAHTSLWEGLGIVLIEALACGTPVVAMNCPHGPAEILENGRYGRLVPLGDTDGFTEALKASIDNPGDTTSYRKRARDFRADVSGQAYMHTLGLGPRRSSPHF